MKDINVSTLLKQYKVEYVATTDDPCDDLAAHGKYRNTVVAPTFRQDKLLSLDKAYLKRLGEAVGYDEITTLADLLRAAEERLRYFVARGCKVSDHGFLRFPSRYPSREEAERLFAAGEKEQVFGYLLVELAKLYKKYGVIMQLHFAVTRNVNEKMYKQCGADAGFDVIADGSRIGDVIKFFRQLSDEERPETILYTLNDGGLPALVCLTGAFRHVKAGAAWWFNDTVQGIRKNLSVIAEYSVLGTNYGMLTDSRSFSSYARFDFFRRILSDYLGDLVEKGEYDKAAAKELARNVCYFNIKKALGI
ncbi:MAG: glucuronate isomerase [Christensenellaceae bacterium]